MTIPVACQCGARFNAKPELAGKTLACPTCKQPLKIPSSSPPQTQAQTQQTADPFADVGFGDSDMGNGDPFAGAGFPDAQQQFGAPQQFGGQQQAYPQQSFSQPASAPKKKGGKGLLIGLGVGGAAFALLLLCGCGGFLIWMFAGSMVSPTASFNEFVAAVENEDFGGIWDRMDENSHDQFAVQLERMRNMAGSQVMRRAMGIPDLEGMSDREAFIAIMENSSTVSGGFRSLGEPPEVISQEIDGNNATLTVKNSNGVTSKVSMVWENGSWKINSSGRKPW